MDSDGEKWIWHVRPLPAHLVSVRPPSRVSLEDPRGSVSDLAAPSGGPVTSAAKCRSLDLSCVRYRSSHRIAPFWYFASAAPLEVGHSS